MIGAWALAAGGAALFDAHDGVRAPLVLSFLAGGPGLALTGALRLQLGDWLEELGTAVAISLVCATLLATGMSYAGSWSPGAALAALIAMTMGAVSIDVRARSGNLARGSEG